MTIENTILLIKRELIRAFAVLDEWFDKDEELHLFKPQQDAWAVREILEQVMLTSHYLLTLIDKSCEKALEKSRVENLQEALMDYKFELDALEAIGMQGTFEWGRIDHMQPIGAKSIGEVRMELRDQLDRCLCHLEILSNGEGILHKTMTSVNGIGKIDVYQYIYFLARHIKRHLTQLEKIEMEYANH